MIGFEVRGISERHRAAKAIGDKLGVDWTKIPLEQLRQGIEVEWDEHQDVHHGDANIAARIALAHLKERPDYYDHLKILERYGCEPRAKVRIIRAPPPPPQERKLKLPPPPDYSRMRRLRKRE